jgi:hypothetical protein
MKTVSCFFLNEIQITGRELIYKTKVFDKYFGFRVKIRTGLGY